MIYYHPSNKTTRRSRVVGRARAIGNRVGLNGSPEFESLLLRQQKSHPIGWLFCWRRSCKEIRTGGSPRSGRKKNSPGDCFSPTLCVPAHGIAPGESLLCPSPRRARGTAAKNQVITLIRVKTPPDSGGVINLSAIGFQIGAPHSQQTERLSF